MERSAGAAEKSAAAGLEALSLNRRALVLAGIPHMQMIYSKLTKPLAVGENPVVEAQVSNLGKGTAYKLRLSSSIRLAPKFEFPEVTESGAPSVFNLAPGTDGLTMMRVRRRDPLTAEQLKLIEGGQLKLFYYGRATYYDNTFEKPKKYTWEWCTFYNPGQNETTFFTCPEHNSNDPE